MELRPDQLERRQARMARRSRRVAWAKIGLPVAAVALIGAIFLGSRDRGGDITDLFTAEELARLGAGLRLENPRLAGVTDMDQPYELTAIEALPDGPLAEKISFSQPSGRIELDDRTIEADAEGGLLDRIAGRLDLEGSVRLSTSDGWRGETERITVDLEGRSARSDGPVRATGPNGELEAGLMRIEQAGGPGGVEPTIWFENRVRVLFIPANDE